MLARSGGIFLSLGAFLDVTRLKLQAQVRQLSLAIPRVRRVGLTRPHLLLAGERVLMRK